MARPEVVLELWIACAKVSPRSYLSREMFDQYRARCDAAGAIFNRDIRAQLCELDQVPLLMSGLREAGFDPRVDEALAKALAARAVAARQDLSSAAERLKATQTALRAQGLKLYPFQEAGVAWLAPRRAALLADEMGLGKTIQALLASPADSPLLVVCPAVVKGVWLKETIRWRPDLAPVVLKGRGSFRWPGAGELIILNYDILPPTAAEINAAAGDNPLAPPPTRPGPPPGLTLIADECHALKSRQAKRTGRFRALAKSVRDAGGRSWGLTGTPLLNRPPELWTVLENLDLALKAYGSWPVFCRAFSGSRGWYGYEWGRPQPAAAEMLKKVSLHRRRAEVLPDLPAKTRRELEVYIKDAETIELADKLLEAIRAAGVDLSCLIETSLTSRLEGVPFELLSRARKALAVAKVPALLDLVGQYEEQEEPIVVFSAHRPPVDVLAQRPGWAVITGDTRDRQRIVELFQAGQLKGIALTIDAGGVGLTLTRASDVVFVDLDWTPALNQQAEDRVCRIGQSRGVIITRLVADHELDRRVAELLRVKEEIIVASVEASAVKDVAATICPDSLSAAAAADRPTPKVQRTAAYRPARTAAEGWASRACLRLAALDPDGAQELNEMGFNKLDNDFGHKMAAMLRERGGLTDNMWAAVIQLCSKYWRQVGRPPEVMNGA